MSPNEPSNVPTNSKEQTPDWAINLLQRIEQLEASSSSNYPFHNEDPNVQIRFPGADFTPTAEMLQQCPYIQKDFFRHTLLDTDRRRFIFDCPKNTLRTYEPPKSIKVSQSTQAKIINNHLYDIQYRLSGITRPLDWFTYQLLYNNWTPEQQQQHTLDFLANIDALLSDLASHLTTLRQENVCKGLPTKVSPPSADDNLLMDPKELADHIKLQQSIQQTTNKKFMRNKPRHKNSFNNDTNSGVTNEEYLQSRFPHSNNSYDTKQSNNFNNPKNSNTTSNNPFIKNSFQKFHSRHHSNKRI
ncbi:unnamed protein product [Cunninghamella echinulata]